jgi:hypothetical protein
MSIIIVGVGSADFGSMIELDSDDQLLSFEGQTAVRDIVQFVPFTKVSEEGPEALAREVLAEIPNQVLEFFNVAH